jgi:hypothetical protein
VYTISGIGSSQRVTGLRVTAGLLPMLGAVAARGRLFTREDDRVGAPQVVVLSEGYWRSRFGGRDDVVGQSVTIENRPCVIAGVVSQEFPLLGSLFAGAPIDIYLPLTRDPAADNIGAFMTVLGRLRAGATLEQAGAILAARRPVIAAGRPCAGPRTQSRLFQPSAKPCGVSIDSRRSAIPFRFRS